MIAIIVTNSPRRRYTFHFEDSNEAKNIAYLLGQGEEWERNLSRIKTNATNLLNLLNLDSADYSIENIDGDRDILSEKDILACKFFLGIIDRQINLNEIGDSSVIIECSANNHMEVVKFKNYLKSRLKDTFSNLETNAPETEDLAYYRGKVDKQYKKFESKIINQSHKELKREFHNIISALEEFRYTMSTYIDRKMKFSIYNSKDLQHLGHTIEKLELRYSRLEKSNKNIKTNSIQLNIPMSKSTTFILDSDGSNFTRFLTGSEQMRIIKQKKKGNLKWSYKLGDYDLFSNNSELVNNVLPYIHRIGKRREILQTTLICSLNGNLEILLSDDVNYTKPEYYFPKITIIKKENQGDKIDSIGNLEKRISKIKNELDLTGKLIHLDDEDLRHISKNLSSKNADICLYLKHPKDPLEEEYIFEWIKENDLHKLCNNNESFTYLNCEFIQQKQEENEINVRFSKLFLDEEE